MTPLAAATDRVTSLTQRVAALQDQATIARAREQGKQARHFQSLADKARAELRKESTKLNTLLREAGVDAGKLLPIMRRYGL